MSRQLIAAAVAALLVCSAGLVGVVAADGTPTPERTDSGTDAPAPDDTDDGTDADAPAAEPLWLANLSGFLAGFDDVPAADREAIAAEAAAMRADGASVADVHHMVHYKLYGFGYDTADVHRAAVEFRLTERYDLTDAEAAAVVDGYVERRDAGADPRDLRAYAIETLAGYGADVPDGADRLAARFDLSVEAEADLRATIVEQLRSDATPREAVRAVASDLREAGVSRAELRDLVRDLRDARAERVERAERDRPVLFPGRAGPLTGE